MCRFFGSTGVCRWTPISMHVVMKRIVTMPRLKRRLPSDAFRPQKVSDAISEHQIFKKVFLGEHAPRLPSIILRIWVQVSVSQEQCNFASTLFMYIDGWSCFQRVSMQIFFTAKHMLFTHSRPTSKSFPTALLGTPRHSANCQLVLVPLYLTQKLIK